jgi:hypothetical protein
MHAPYVFEQLYAEHGFKRSLFIWDTLYEEIDAFVAHFRVFTQRFRAGRMTKNRQFS